MLLLVVQSQGLQRGKSIVGGKEGSATGDFSVSLLEVKKVSDLEGKKISLKKITAFSRNKH